MATGFANIDPIRLLRRYWMLLAASAFMGAVIGTAGHFVLLRVYPMYTSAALFQIRPPTSSTISTGTESVQQSDFDRFMGTQMQLMTSSDVLQKALNNPNLAGTGWAKQFYVNGSFQPTRALPALQDKISARMINQTTLIRLSMTWKDRNDVRTVVEAVANAYMQDLRNTENTQSADRRQVLGNRRDQINEQIKTLNRNRDGILSKGGMTNLREGADEADQRQARITQDLVEAQQQGAQINSMLERLKNLQADNAVIPYPDDMLMEAKADPIIMNLNQQITQLKVDEASLRAQGFDSQHPAVQAILKRIDATKAEQDSQMRVVLDRIYNSRLEDLNKSVESSKAREKKLIDELSGVQTRKQDLLKLVLQVEQIEVQTKELNDQLTEITRAQQEMENLSNNPVFDRVRQISAPQTPTDVTFPKLAVMLPLGVLLLTGLTASVILLRELMDQRVKGPADVAMIPRLRVLGMVPDASEDPSRPGSVETAFRDTPGGVVTESFRQVRAPLVSKLDAEGLRSVLFLAGMPGSGGTTVAANLALACAGADDRVLLIDANFRRPALHRVMGIGEALGLADCLAGQTTLADAVRPGNVPNLSVLTAGSAGNRMLPERLSSESMARVLAEAASKYDRVFIDAPPAIVSGDGLAIANRCDAVVMVVRAMNEKRGLVNRIRMQLSNTRAELLGVVVNGVKSSAGGYFKRNIQATHDYHNAGKA
jgi:capsular exopolysaccharide synthesis family protein